MMTPPEEKELYTYDILDINGYKFFEEINEPVEDDFFDYGFIENAFFEELIEYEPINSI